MKRWDERRGFWNVFGWVNDWDGLWIRGSQRYEGTRLLLIVSAPSVYVCLSPRVNDESRTILCFYTFNNPVPYAEILDLQISGPVYTTLSISMDLFKGREWEKTQKRLTFNTVPRDRGPNWGVSVVTKNSSFTVYKTSSLKSLRKYPLRYSRSLKETDISKIHWVKGKD